MNINVDGCAGLMLIHTLRTYSFKHTYHINDTNEPFTLITYKAKYVLSRYSVHLLFMILNHIKDCFYFKDIHFKSKNVGLCRQTRPDTNHTIQYSKCNTITFVVILRIG